MYLLNPDDWMSIYNYAKAQKKEQIDQILKLKGSTINVSGFCIFLPSWQHLITVLAKEGDFQTVDFLISEYADIDIFEAIKGYAMGGYDEKVWELIPKQKDGIYAAIVGYAYKGDSRKVEELLEISDNNIRAREAAAGGFAFGNHVAEVEKYIALGVPLYAVGDHFEMAGCFKDTDSLLKLLSSTNNPVTRNYLAGKATNVLPQVDEAKILKKAAKLNLLMNQDSLTFEEALDAHSLHSVEKNVKDLSDAARLQAFGLLNSSPSPKESPDLNEVRSSHEFN